MTRFTQQMKLDQLASHTLFEVQVITCASDALPGECGSNVTTAPSNISRTASTSGWTAHRLQAWSLHVRHFWVSALRTAERGQSKRPHPAGPRYAAEAALSSALHDTEVHAVASYAHGISTPVRLTAGSIQYMCCAFAATLLRSLHRIRTAFSRLRPLCLSLTWLELCAEPSVEGAAVQCAQDCE